MENIDEKRKLLNFQQTELRKILTKYNQHERAVRAFLDQHAKLHSALVSHSGTTISDFWSFEDAVLNDITDDQYRRIPLNCEHSIAWCIWHIARIEDVAMNLLVADTQQLLNQGNWYEQLRVKFRDTGNAFDDEAMTILSKEIDITALREYRVAVGWRTREIVREILPGTLKNQVKLERIERVKDEGAVVEAAYGIADYWSKRNIAGLLLMPASRHSLVHLNEALRLSRRYK
jgi:hypothetical protein